MLNLPHHHCNSVYAPWLSKGQRATITIRDNFGTSLFFFLFSSQPDSVSPLIVRSHAMGLSGPQGSVHPSIAGFSTDSNTRSPTDPPTSPSPRLRIDTHVGGCVDGGKWRRKSMGTGAYPAGEGRSHGPALLTPMRYDSPVSSVACDGWCRYDVIPFPIVVSIIPRVRLRR